MVFESYKKKCPQICLGRDGPEGDFCSADNATWWWLNDSSTLQNPEVCKGSSSSSSSFHEGVGFGRVV
jgi:hypothetical protein